MRCGCLHDLHNRLFVQRGDEGGLLDVGVAANAEHAVRSRAPAVHAAVLLQRERVVEARNNLSHRKSEAIYVNDAIFRRMNALQAELPESAAAAREHLARQRAEHHEIAAHGHGPNLHVRLHVHVGSFDSTGYGREGVVVVAETAGGAVAPGEQGARKSRANGCYWGGERGSFGILILFINGDREVCSLHAHTKFETKALWLQMKSCYSHAKECECHGNQPSQLHSGRTTASRALL